jgi:hypothetical protein
MEEFNDIVTVASAIRELAKAKQELIKLCID